MSTIASKNLYELLGNDPELDPDRAPEPPTKAIDKPVARTGKRNAGPEAPAAAARDAQRAPAAARGGRTDNARGDGVNQRSERREDGQRERRPRDGQFRGEGRGRGRGGRGGRGDRPPRDDRHSHTGIGEHAKQAAQGWGAEQDGNAEWADEKAGEAIASAEAKDENDAANEEADAEPEPKTVTLDQFRAEQAEKRAALGSLEVRKANEGAKTKAPEGKAFARDPDAENFIVGTGGKTRKTKEQGKKEHLVVDGQYYAAAESSDRGASRGGRGGRGGRGEFRGGRGDRGDRGGRGGRGRGGESRGSAAPRGAPRGGAAFNATDSSAFPALGGN